MNSIYPPNVWHAFDRVAEVHGSHEAALRYWLSAGGVFGDGSGHMGYAVAIAQPYNHRFVPLGLRSNDVCAFVVREKPLLMCGFSANEHLRAVKSKEGRKGDG